MMSFMVQATRALFALPLLIPSCQGPDTHVALGVLARERVALTATANEIITELPVAEGQSVTAGTVLVQLDDRLAQANLDVTLANRAQAQADLERLQTGAREEEIAIAKSRVDGTRAVYHEAQSTVERNSQLLKRGTITQASLDQDIARRNAALAELRSAEQALLEIETGAREEDIRIAEAKLFEYKQSVVSPSGDIGLGKRQFKCCTRLVCVCVVSPSGDIAMCGHSQAPELPVSASFSNGSCV